ncbi:MAG: hypothetical protein KJ593_08420 [Candidatus Omnitrophica bacterium]|nr:hypothetical protein [Candidatus Omnitrophota bacterium]
MYLIKTLKKFPKYLEARTMKEVLLKNISSIDKRRKLFSSCVINQGKDYITTTRRKYIYLVKKIKHSYKKNFQTHVFINKQRDSRKHMQKFNCLLKGAFYACGTDCFYLIRYAHSLEVERKILTI